MIAFCVKEFPTLFAYDFTAKMEERLDSVAKGKEPWKNLCRDTWESYKSEYERLKSKESAPSASDKVRDFGGGFKAVMSKAGTILVQEPADPKDKTLFYTFPKGFTLQNITEEAARDWVQQQLTESNVGLWEGKPIMKKKGPYGMYLQCGELRVPFVESDTLEKILEKFRERAVTAAGVYKFGPYTFSRGQFGPYMYKHDLKTKVFIGIPENLDPKTLTADEADAIYKAGVETKKASGFRGRGGAGAAGAGAGARGRGGFRGRGRGN